MQRPFRILIWSRTVICWRSYNGDLQGLLKEITRQHPVCPRCCMILAGVTLKTAGGTLDWLCSTRLSLGTFWFGSCGQQDHSKSQIQIHRYRNTDTSSTGLRYSFADRTVSDWNQLPAVVVEQENPAAFKAQLARSAPAACRMP